MSITCRSRRDRAAVSGLSVMRVVAMGGALGSGGVWLLKIQPC
jgi:hypothetical protein